MKHRQRKRTMVKAIYQAARNLEFKMKNTEIVANNLANIGTVGYKRELPFSELMTRDKGAGFKQLTDFSEGNSIATNNALDVAIEGSALFVVKDDSGLHMTRDGRFSISVDGFLETANHARVQGEKGDINLYETLLNKDQIIGISKEGEIKMGETYVDRFRMGKITSQQNLLRNNAQDFAFEDGTITPAEPGSYKFTQGYVEESNVSIVMEMESMITLNKDYEAAQKIIGFFDQSLAKAAEVGKV